MLVLETKLGIDVWRVSCQFSLPISRYGSLPIVNSFTLPTPSRSATSLSGLLRSYFGNCNLVIRNYSTRASRRDLLDFSPGKASDEQSTTHCFGAHLRHTGNWQGLSEKRQQWQVVQYVCTRLSRHCCALKLHQTAHRPPRLFEMIPLKQESQCQGIPPVAVAHSILSLLLVPPLVDSLLPYQAALARIWAL